MTNQEILPKAIEKAIAGGWEPFQFGKPTSIEQWQEDMMVQIAVVFPLHNEPVTWVRELEGIIFNHDFAKALWGDNLVFTHDLESGETFELSTTGETKDVLPAYKHHLQEMVIADDPIKYLGENI